MRHFKNLSARKPLKASQDTMMEKLDMLAPVFEQDPEAAMDLLNSLMSKDDGATTE